MSFQKSIKSQKKLFFVENVVERVSLVVCSHRNFISLGPKNKSRNSCVSFCIIIHKIPQNFVFFFSNHPGNSARISPLRYDKCRSSFV